MIENENAVDSPAEPKRRLSTTKLIKYFSIVIIGKYWFIYYFTNAFRTLLLKFSFYSFYIVKNKQIRPMFAVRQLILGRLTLFLKKRFNIHTKNVQEVQNCNQITSKLTKLQFLQSNPFQPTQQHNQLSTTNPFGMTFGLFTSGYFLYCKIVLVFVYS